MDTFELNKFAGAVLFALMVLFGTRTVSNIIFAVPEPEKPGYEVEVAEQEGAGQQTAEAEPEVPLAKLLQEASAEQGESAARKCQACHTFEQGGANKIGPNLYGVVGREVANVPDFDYSSAMQEEGGTWTYEKLNTYLADPKGAIPGNRMAFAGLKRDSERADMLLYLRDHTENPPPLPEPAADEGGQQSGQAQDGEAEAPQGQGGEPQSQEKTQPEQGAEPAPQSGQENGSQQQPEQGQQQDAPQSGEGPGAQEPEQSGQGSGAQQPGQSQQAPEGQQGGDKPAQQDEGQQGGQQ